MQLSKAQAVIIPHWLPEDAASGTNCIAWQAGKQSIECQQILPGIKEDFPQSRHTNRQTPV